MYGFEKINQYAYGRPTNFEKDHKRLATILQKPLSQAPKRLQDIMMRYYRYDIQFVFVKATNLLIADTLSRAHQENTGDKQDDHALTINVSMCSLTSQTSDLMRYAKRLCVMLVCKW